MADELTIALLDGDQAKPGAGQMPLLTPQELAPGVSIVWALSERFDNQHLTGSTHFRPYLSIICVHQSLTARSGGDRLDPIIGK